MKSINFLEKFEKFSEHWTPKVIAEMNDYQFKLAKVAGEFVWHSHADTDETFIVLKGDLCIKFRDGEVSLSEGEMYVVPKGVEHLPSAENECQILPRSASQAFLSLCFALSNLSFCATPFYNTNRCTSFKLLIQSGCIKSIALTIYNIKLI